jgi:hypothetical protein
VCDVVTVHLLRWQIPLLLSAGRQAARFSCLVGSLHRGLLSKGTCQRWQLGCEFVWWASGTSTHSMAIL